MREIKELPPPGMLFSMGFALDVMCVSAWITKQKSHARGKNTVIINLTTIVSQGNDIVTIKTHWPLS